MLTRSFLLRQEKKQVINDHEFSLLLYFFHFCVEQTKDDIAMVSMVAK